MLGKLGVKGLSSLYKLYIRELKLSGFLGDIEDDEASRIVESTDNSIYQVVPECILFPKNEDDIKIAFELANKEDDFHKIKFSPRGGGTGTNGQSLTYGIMIDCSRYMNNIKHIDCNKKQVTVEPGVVLGQLNATLAFNSLFFAPDVSSGSRATIGGMVSTDACGKSSIIYGRTSDHVNKIKCILVDGSIMEFKRIPLSEIQHQSNKSKEIHGKIYQLLSNNKDEIENVFPKMTRFMTGYNLDKIIDYKEGTMNLNYLLSGSEGTLAYISEITLNLVDFPKYKILFAIQYSSFLNALSDGYTLLRFKPSAIETIDDNILSIAKCDPIYAHISHMILNKSEVALAGINLMEFIAESEDEMNAISSQVVSFLDKSDVNTGFYCASDSDDISALWELRRKGVGLLGAMQGNRKPIPFMEDTAVPPKYLSNYINDIRQLLDFYGLKYGMFGHVDAGCLHMRPALDMNIDKDRRLVPVITKEVNALVKKYHGVYWSEHGKGYRSEYVVDYFGSTLYQSLRDIKYFFDIHNQMNPGKIVVPTGSAENVVSVDGPYRGYMDEDVSKLERKSYSGAFNCNGNAACLNYDFDEVMCPSAKVSRNWSYSPKGRAALLREWLRKRSLRDAGKFKLGQNIWFSFFKRCYFFIFKPKDDFSREVYRSLSECLGCKACATACPIKVDIPNMKSKFLQDYHSRYPRLIRDYLISANERIALFLVKCPNIVKYFVNRLLKLRLFKKLFSFSMLPEFNIFEQNKAKIDIKRYKFSWNKAKNLKATEKEKTICLVYDLLLLSYEAEVLSSACRFLINLGYNVYILPLRESGKGYHALGFLKSFGRIAKNNISFYNKIAKLGIPLVGIEPSLTLCYRDEYLEEYKDLKKFNIMLLSEWLVLELSNINTSQVCIPPFKKNIYLYSHCTEKSLVSDSDTHWKSIYSYFGCSIEIKKTGCCGMAGNYGYQAETYSSSKKIYDLSWKGSLDKLADDSVLLATGFSCRSQVARFNKQKTLVHPIVFLDNFIQTKD